MFKRILLISLLLAVVLVSASITIAQEEAVAAIDLDHPYAAFLESRAFAAEQGATAEFRKMEWVVIDDANMKLYVTMSEVSSGMADGEGDVSVDENPCGAVYAADLDENYNMSELKPILFGGPYDPEGGANRCAVDNISNPDGLALDAQGRLWILEDTGNHENNMIWRYDVNSGELLRFGYVPLGAEITGGYITEQGTLFFSNQHPDAQNLYPHNAGTVVAVNGFDANNDDFESIAIPEGDARLTVGVAAGELNVLGRAGDVIPGSIKNHILGGVYNVAGELQSVINDPDGIMWLPIDEAGTQGWLYVNYEARPGGVARLFVRQTEAGWETVEGEMVDFTGVNGTWNNCGSSVTPWMTGLTSEEYEPVSADPASIAPMSEYMGAVANPYDYGYIVELTPDELGDEVVKHYVMGRKSNENSFTAGDSRTVYFGDDGTNTVLFKFVADEAGDLSAGTLYAAAVTQTGGTGAEHVFELEWIELGSATNDEILEAIRALDV